MALIGKIRKNSWILVLMVGLGLFGFVLMSMIRGKGNIFSGSNATLASIAGKKIDINDFNRDNEIVENTLYRNAGGNALARRNYLFNYFIDEAIISKEAEENGLGVSKDELLELEFGKKLSPIIQQRFQNPQTRQINRESLNSFKQQIENNSLDKSMRYFWAHQEKEIIKDRLQSKLVNMISKGLYVPNWMAEMLGKEQGTKLDFNYVRIPFEAKDVSDISVADEDYQNYLNAHKAQFYADEETRKIEYTTIDVIASPQDSAAYRDTIAALVPRFRATKNDSSFTESYYGTFDAAYYKKDVLSDKIADTIFKMPIGGVFGPYLDGNAYKAVKLVDRKMIPDSVKSRHILIKAKTQEEYLAAQKTIDSLKTLMESGKYVFDSLAAKYSQGPTGVKGGDLGYVAPGAMVPEFNNLIFYQAEKGKYYTVATQFGVHLVEVTGKKFINNEEGVRLAYISQSITPGEVTTGKAKDIALELIDKYKRLDELRAAIDKNDKLSMTVSPPLKRNDYAIQGIGSNQSARSIVQWAFGDARGTDAPDVGDVSPELYDSQNPVEFYIDKFFVVGLKSIQPKGTPSVAGIKEELEPFVFNEKKAALIKSEISGNDLAAIASKFDVKVDTAKSVSLANGAIPKIGQEPAVVAAAYKLNTNEVSQPIVGKSGVYVVQLTNKITPPAASNLATTKNSLARSTKSIVKAKLLTALKKKADIEDNRAKFW